MASVAAEVPTHQTSKDTAGVWAEAWLAKRLAMFCHCLPGSCCSMQSGHGRAQAQHQKRMCSYSCKGVLLLRLNPAVMWAARTQ